MGVKEKDMMQEKEPKKMTLPELMQKHGASLCITTSEGFANVEFQDGKLMVKLLNEEGYANEESEWDVQTVLRVADFVRDLKEMKLEEYSKPLKK